MGSERPKVFRTLLYIAFLARCALVRHLSFQAVQTLAVLYALVSECASRFHAVSFVDIVTSKSVPNMKCFYFFASKGASCHSNVQFCISHVRIWPDGRFNLATVFFFFLGFRTFVFSHACFFVLPHLSILFEILAVSFRPALLEKCLPRLCGFCFGTVHFLYLFSA